MSNQRSSLGRTDELSPAYVYCGHKGPVLCLVTPSVQMTQTKTTALYSGGLDGSIRSWRLPSTLTGFGLIDIYAQHDLDLVTGPVYQTVSPSPCWTMVAHPSNPLLISAHSDGSINLWSTANESENQTDPLVSIKLAEVAKLSGHDQLEFGRPTCLHLTTTSECVVGTSTGWMFLLDVQTGKVVNQLAPAPPLSNSGDDPTMNMASISESDQCNLPSGWSERALNALTSHQTLSLVIGAHEDRCIRFYDIGRMSDSSTGTNTACIDAMVTHLDAVTSLAMDRHGLYLLTGSHDASIRVWDMDSRTCIQEMTNHAYKYGESVHSIALHPQLPFAASAGADAICKVYVAVA